MLGAAELPVHDLHRVALAVLQGDDGRGRVVLAQVHKRHNPVQLARRAREPELARLQTADGPGAERTLGAAVAGNDASQGVGATDGRRGDRAGDGWGQGRSVRGGRGRRNQCGGRGGWGGKNHQDVADAGVAVAGADRWLGKVAAMAMRDQVVGQPGLARGGRYGLHQVGAGKRVPEETGQARSDYLAVVVGRILRRRRLCRPARVADVGDGDVAAISGADDQVLQAADDYQAIGAPLGDLGPDAAQDVGVPVCRPGGRWADLESEPFVRPSAGQAARLDRRAGGRSHRNGDAVHGDAADARHVQGGEPGARVRGEAERGGDRGGQGKDTQGGLVGDGRAHVRTLIEAAPGRGVNARRDDSAAVDQADGFGHGK